jgi:hypothetical protein
VSAESHSGERQRGVALFNGTWELLGSREDDDRMLHMAHASRYHWGEAPECRPENLARGEWLISRVYCVLGRAEPALWHGRRCLERVEEAGVGDWDLAYAYEALARASAVAGDAAAAGEWRARARQAGDAIGDPEDREHFDEEFATL